MNQVKNAVIFARVSTADQTDGHSIEAQLVRLREYCQRKGLNIIKEFSIVESSTRGNRKQFHAMLDYCLKQKECIALVADAVDRVQRSFKDTELLNTHIRADKLELHTLREGYIVNALSGAMHLMSWDFSTIMAKSYVLSMTENVKRSTDLKIKNGEWPHRAPLGYLNQKCPTTGKSIVVLDPDRALLVKRIFEDYATGVYSIHELAEKAYDWGLRGRDRHAKVNITQIHDAICSPFYFGEMVIKGKHYRHIHPQLITKDLWDKCQAVRLGYHRQQFKYNCKESLFRGMMCCQYCGRAICTDHKVKKERHFTYLFCTKHKKVDCPNTRQREEVILSQLADAMRQISFPDELLDTVREELDRAFRGNREFQENRLRLLQQEATTLKARQDRLMDIHLDGSITKQQYDEKRTEITDRLAQITRELGDLELGDNRFEVTVKLLLQLMKDLPRLFQGSKMDEKRQILKFLFTNLTMKDSSIGFVWNKPFGSIAEAAEHNTWLGRKDSNPRMAGPKPAALPLGDSPAFGGASIHLAAGGNLHNPPALVNGAQQKGACRPLIKLADKLRLLAGLVAHPQSPCLGEDSIFQRPRTGRVGWRIVPGAAFGLSLFEQRHLQGAGLEFFT